MPTRREDPAKAKPESENKKKAETTILTPDELRAISGGLGGTPPPKSPPPPPIPGVVVKG